MRLLLVLRSRCLKKLALVLQASLSMAVLIEGLLFAFHLQVGFDLGMRKASRYAADSTSQLLHDLGGSLEHPQLTWPRLQRSQLRQPPYARLYVSIFVSCLLAAVILASSSLSLSLPAALQTTAVALARI